MEPTIYKFDKLDTPVKKVVSEFSQEPSPKLIKYGYNKETDKISILNLIDNPNYKNGLTFDFDRTDSNSIKHHLDKTFGLKLSSVNDYKKFCICWEILNLFDLLNKSQTIASNVDVLSQVTDTYQKFFKSKTKFEFVKKSTIASLVFKTFSDVDLEENACAQILMNDLSDLLSKQTTKSSMIIQIFQTQTPMMSQIITYLSGLYEETYIIKPITVSVLSDEKYIVLINLISETNFERIKSNKDMYVVSLGLSVPESVVNTTQCINSNLIPMKIKSYYEIKSYIDSKLYTGGIYDDFLKRQNTNITEWISIFTDKDKMKKFISDSLDKTTSECDYVAKWNSLSM